VAEPDSNLRPSLFTRLLDASSGPTLPGDPVQAVFGVHSFFCCVRVHSDSVAVKVVLGLPKASLLIL